MQEWVLQGRVRLFASCYIGNNVGRAASDFGKDELEWFLAYNASR